MAQYGLETETTVHIKGMQFGDSQPDTGGGIYNAILVKTNDARIDDDSHTCVVVTSTLPESSIEGDLLMIVGDYGGEFVNKVKFTSSISGYENLMPIVNKETNLVIAQKNILFD